MQVESSQVVGGYQEGTANPVAFTADSDGALLTSSGHLQKRHFTDTTGNEMATDAVGVVTATW